METQKDNQQKWWVPAIMYYVRVTTWIALPIISVLVLDRYIDISASRSLFALALISAFVLSVYGILNEVKRYKKSLDTKDSL
jgi:hypothetical protein